MPAAPDTDNALYLGLDLGTSGVRALVIDAEGQAVDTASRPLAPPDQADDGGHRQDPALWLDAALAVIAAVATRQQARPIRAIAVDGTSGTLLLTDARGTPLSPGSMYNDASASALSAKIAAVAPAESAAHGATSPLARLLAMQGRYPKAHFALHQADWVAGHLTGRFGLSDDNNALKLGWDPVQRCWPDWLDALGVRRRLLPQVATPGTVFGPISPKQAHRLTLPPSTMIVAGTTDGCASFLATGADAVGDAVTALGSTLTVKLLSDRPLFAPQFGVYSHRLGTTWLAGGASNTGGAALLQFFSTERMNALTPQLRPGEPTGLDYYPLPGRGERFPVADPGLASRPTPPGPKTTPGSSRGCWKGLQR